MGNTKIGICNIALASLGEDAIRSFEENNKRARMCDVFFESTRNYLLSKFDWPFARKYASLSAIDYETTGLVVPSNQYPYQLPSDCITPRDIAPKGSKTWWEVREGVLYCRTASGAGVDVFLYYTARATDPGKFSDTFVSLQALNMAVRMGPAITQDKALVKLLYEQFLQEQRDMQESDANIGNDYRAFNENPDNDTFVYPDGYEAAVFGDD